MDSIDLRNQNDIEAIKEALTTGAITLAEIDVRLHALVDYETSKPAKDINANLVSACADLLWKLHAQETAQIPDRKAEIWTGIEHSLKKSSMRSKRSKRTLRIAIATAAVFVLLFLGETVLHRQWLQGTQSPDEQQLILEGKVVDPGLVAHGNATQEDGVHELTTMSLLEVEAFLGFVPPCPTEIPEIWVLQGYYAARTKNIVVFHVSYKHEEKDHLLTYEFDRYLDAEFMRDEIEQNERGLTIHLNNGQKAYVTENIDNSVCLWVNDLDVYMLSGPIEQKELQSIAESVQ